MRYIILALFIFLMLWTVGFMVADLSLAYFQPVGEIKENGLKVHVWGLNFWPEGLFEGKMNWPPFCFNITWGDHTLNSEEWFAAHPDCINRPLNGRVYVDQVAFRH